jgi:hypothetical protein
MSLTTILLGTTAIILLAASVRFLTKAAVYPAVDLADVDRWEHIERMEKVLESSESWRVSRQDGGVSVSSSREPAPVRAVRYQVIADCDFERGVDYVKGLCDCGPAIKQKPDKVEETLYDKDRGGNEHEWVRRSVHISPPPAGSRDATVFYFEDRPAEKVYRIGFRSVDSIDGRPVEPWEGAARFTVHDAIYKVDEIAPGRTRIRKVEPVDPQGLVSPLLNDYFVAPFFFMKYMFEEAKEMRDGITAPKG